MTGTGASERRVEHAALGAVPPDGGRVPHVGVDLGASALALFSDNSAGTFTDTGTARQHQTASACTPVSAPASRADSQL